MNKWQENLRTLFDRYKFVLLVVLIGIAFMLLPGTKSEIESEKVETNHETETSTETLLESILTKIDGAGRVEVMLSVAKGAKTEYQVNSSQSESDSNSNIQTDTVIVADSDRGENGLILQVTPATYLGAIIVCDGADSPRVMLDIVDAVSKVTGLGADRISVLKMK